MRIIETTDKGFSEILSGITGRGETDTSAVEPAVRDIIDSVRQDGDRALATTLKFEWRR